MYFKTEGEMNTFSIIESSENFTWRPELQQNGDREKCRPTERKTRNGDYIGY